MNLLKTIWPTAFFVKTKDVPSFVTQLIIFGLAVVIFGITMSLLARINVIPFISTAFYLLGASVELYSMVGIALCILNYFGLLSREDK